MCRAGGDLLVGVRDQFIGQPDDDQSTHTTIMECSSADWRMCSAGIYEILIYARKRGSNRKITSAPPTDMRVLDEVWNALH